MQHPEHSSHTKAGRPQHTISCSSPSNHLVDPFRSLERPHDCRLALEKLLIHRASVAQPHQPRVKPNKTAKAALTSSPRTSCTPLSTSARDRNPFPLGSNCWKILFRSALSDSLFPVGSFAASSLHSIFRPTSSFLQFTPQHL